METQNSKSTIMNNMNKITVKPEKGTNNLVRPYKKTPEKGYMVIESSEQVVQGGWIKEVTRTALIKGKCTLLEALAKNGVPGRIVVLEYLESEVPDHMLTYLDQSKDYDDRIEQFIKRAGEDGPEMCVGGERIIRFSIWDSTGQMKDIIVQHDNQAEIAQWRKENAES